MLVKRQLSLSCSPISMKNWRAAQAELLRHQRTYMRAEVIFMFLQIFFSSFFLCTFFATPLPHLTLKQLPANSFIQPSAAKERR